MGAARGLCGHRQGVVSILGTGSNSCYYDGRKIAEQIPSLGYMVGDEGSGNHMGKRVLQYYAYHTFDNELKLGFEMMFGNDLHQITHRLYKEPFPNRYLASFCQLLSNNRGHYMVENIVEDCINEFFRHHILKYRSSWKFPLHFTGSIAYEFRDVIATQCHQYELELGTIVHTPLEGLIAFHQKNR
jgi:N-acetylglucosamine kinase-like BadF-type ATPase